MYTENPTLQNTLPHEGIYKLNAPIQCEAGVFDTGSIIRICDPFFDEEKGVVTYGVWGANNSKMIFDCFDFTGSLDKWNKQFVLVKDSFVFYEKMNVFSSKKGNVVKKQNTLDTILMFSFLPILLFGFMPIIITLMDCEGSPSITEVIVAAITATGLIVAFIISSYILEKQFDAICKEEEQYELKYFLAKHNK